MTILLCFATALALSGASAFYGLPVNQATYPTQLATAPSPTIDMSIYDFAPVTQAQADAINAVDDRVLFCGPWGSAKTEAALRKCIVWLGDLPSLRVRWLRQYANEARTIAMPLFLARVPPQWVKDVNKTEGVVTLKPPTGVETHIKFGGLKPSETGQNPWGGTEYGLTVIDEAQKFTDLAALEEMVLRSARQPGIPFNQVMFLCNADTPAHYLYQWFYEGNGPQPSDPALPRITYRLIEGPTIPASAGLLPPAYYAMLDSLRGVHRQRFALNQWAAHEGLVYPYDPRVQLLHRNAEGYVDSTGKLIVTHDALAQMGWTCGCDFGFDHPFVFSWWRQSSGDVSYLQKQIYMTRRTVREHARQIHATHKALGLPEPIQAVCDHDAEDRATLQENGIITRPAYKDRLKGQQAVYEKFPHTDPSDPSGERMTPCRIYFLADDNSGHSGNAVVEEDNARRAEGKPCCTTDELGGYVWASGTKEDMVKTKDDGCDEMRYTHATGKPGEAFYGWA